MTRFARAKGSKASNEKTPEDSTPWEVMKEQMLQTKKENEEAKKRQEAEQERIKNYENFLKERKVQKRKATWCEFSESNSQQPEKGALNESKKKKNEKQETKVANSKAEIKNVTIVNDYIEKFNKNKGKDKLQVVTEKSQSNQINTAQETKQIPKKDKHKKKKDSFEQLTVDAVQNNVTNSDIINKKNQNNSKFVKKKENKKMVRGKPTRRKAIDDHSFQLIINGKDIELIRFDGFPIMKKDAERIEELKNSMIQKGIPKSEVQRTIKLERRRAEKALARLKKDVCYNCRKGGHNLSDCPELKSKIPGVDGADGVCFKCGSTEHRQFECKVQRDKEFRFATCFICKEQGHIARQCPDNPKGLYPNGGCCKLCGDVTHLKKDCPTVKDKKEGSSIKLPTMDISDQVEDIVQQTRTNISKEPSKKPKKIKFF